MEIQKTLDVVMQGLMSRYSERVPDVKKVTQILIENQLINSVEDIENDHVAFRTMGVPQLGIQSFEKIFRHYGYKRMDYFYFAGKKLDAYWYAPPEPHYPRIFVSELRVRDLEPEIQEIIYKYTNQVVADPADSLNLDNGAEVDDFLHKPLWSTPTWEDFSKLSKASEYAAWVIYNRYYLNHYTISVHNLPSGFDDIVKFNELLENHGIKLNDAGGKIKISPDGGLLQSSTVAQMIEAEFADGSIHSIAGSYVEFAQRKVLPEFLNLAANEIKREHRREGFEAGNADKIFESTFSSQTQKN